MGGLLAVLTGLISSQAGAEPSSSGGIYDVRDFGAVGDGATLDTRPIQKAVDACAEANGGKVRLQGGTFLSGTIRLKSNVTLCVETFLQLQGDTCRDISLTDNALLRVKHLKRGE
ncbi:MAG: hypothetical protein JXQ73_27110 [Phycisphaerae bacterium]|nr:hypothetical protein [Phycisphaerae bacterium]